MDKFKSIILVPKEKDYEITNPTSFPLIGRGVQGAVFKLSEERCVKIYVKPSHAELESKALRAAQTSPFFPKLYEAGCNYCIMEYISGPTLKVYLKERGVMENSEVRQLLNILKEMKRLKFKRIDAKLRHILVTESGEFKVIDHVYAMKNKAKTPFELFKGLSKLGLLASFLELVKTMEPTMYRDWESLGGTYEPKG